MRRPFPVIALDPDGFRFIDGERIVATVCWSDIVSIVAYKLDLFTTDEMRICFTIGQEGSRLEVSEEQPGFAVFLEALQARFPLPANWRAAVLKTAFARNETILFARAQTLAQPGSHG